MHFPSSFASFFNMVRQPWKKWWEVISRRYVIYFDRTLSVLFVKTPPFLLLVNISNAGAIVQEVRVHLGFETLISNTQVCRLRWIGHWRLFPFVFILYLYFIYAPHASKQSSVEKLYIPFINQPNLCLPIIRMTWVHLRNALIRRRLETLRLLLWMPFAMPLSLINGKCSW